MSSSVVAMDNYEDVVITPLCDDSLKPFKGKTFHSLDEGVSFYREYARFVGFDIRLSSSKKVNDVLTWRYVVCNREGDKFTVAGDNEMADYDLSNSKIRRRVSSRCRCNAKVLFKYVAYLGYVVHMFVEGHNHEMVDFSHRHFMKVNRHIDIVHQKFILDCAASSIGPTASYNLLMELMGGTDLVGCSVIEVRNFSRDMKAHVEGCDAQMLLNDMKKKKELCDAFIYNFEVDSEDKLTRLFWCDPICRRNFQFFGNSVAFDTTYSTNKYCMIFAPFTGKDNHGKPVTFAAGLISKEDAASFVWLFQNFVDAMGRSPDLIITDQDLGMKVAIERVLTTTRHRWCMWHIMIKVADKISKELRADEDFKKEINACVWSELIEADYFDACWEGIMLRYGLAGDPWFTTMFENRRFWVPAYFRDFNLSGLLRTTSISESENSFYKRYTRSRSNLLEFWMHFNHALDAQRYQSAKLNYLDKSFLPSLSTDLEIEKHAASVYSTKFFQRVLEEIKDSRKRVALIDRQISGGKDTCRILDDLNNKYVVVFDEVMLEYKCSCKLFERLGILCSHIFLLLKNKFVHSIPEKYLIDRWKKAHLIQNVQLLESESLEHYQNVDQSKKMLNRITTSFYGWLQKFDGDVTKISNLLSALDIAGNDISGQDSGVSAGDKNSMFNRYYGAEIPENIIVRPPDVVKTKGSGSRILSRKDKAERMAKKQMRVCKNCKKLATHDSRNCDKVNGAGNK